MKKVLLGMLVLSLAVAPARACNYSFGAFYAQPIMYQPIIQPIYAPAYTAQQAYSAPLTGTSCGCGSASALAAPPAYSAPAQPLVGVQPYSAPFVGGGYQSYSAPFVGGYSAPILALRNQYSTLRLNSGYNYQSLGFASQRIVVRERFVGGRGLRGDFFAPVGVGRASLNVGVNSFRGIGGGFAGFTASRSSLNIGVGRGFAPAFVAPAPRVNVRVRVR